MAWAAEGHLWTSTGIRYHRGMALEWPAIYRRLDYDTRTRAAVSAQISPTGLEVHLLCTAVEEEAILKEATDHQEAAGMGLLGAR